MLSIIQSSTGHLFDLVNQLYRLRDLNTIARAFLDGISPFVPFTSAALFPINPGTYELQDGYHQGNDSAFIDRYLPDDAQFDPCLFHAQCPKRLNDVIRLSDLSPADMNHAVLFARFRERIRCDNALCIVVGWREQPVALIRMQRDEASGDFSDAECELIGRIVPHIGHAITLQEISKGQETFCETGLFVFDASRQLVYQNHSSRHMMPGLHPETILSLALSEIIWQHSDSRLYRLRAIPLRPNSLLNWIDPVLPNAANETETADGGRQRRATIVVSEALKQRQALANRLTRSRLSPREVAVAMGVIRGLSNAEIAEELHIDETTVKDHLRRIYGKIDVRSRTALISRVLGLDVDFITIAQCASGQ